MIMRNINKESQQLLFDVGEEWQNEWQDMPEFVQEDLMSYRTIKVHFESEEDVKRFSELLNQQITQDTKFIWFPEAELGRFANKRYIDACRTEQ